MVWVHLRRCTPGAASATWTQVTICPSVETAMPVPTIASSDVRRIRTVKSRRFWRRTLFNWPFIYTFKYIALPFQCDVDGGFRAGFSNNGSRLRVKLETKRDLKNRRRTCGIRPTRFQWQMAGIKIFLTFTYGSCMSTLVYVRNDKEANAAWQTNMSSRGKD